MVMDALGFLTVKKQCHVVVLVLLSGLFPYCGKTGGTGRKYSLRKIQNGSAAEIERVEALYLSAF
jgi:hypothetical protein